MRILWVVAVALVSASTPLQGQDGKGGFVVLREAYAFPATAGGDAHVYLAIDNFSTMPLAIMRTSTSEAQSVGSIGLGATVSTGEQEASAFFVAAGARLQMEPGRPHLLLIGLTHDLRVGDKVALTLHGLGDMNIPVRVTVRSPPGMVGVPD